LRKPNGSETGNGNASIFRRDIAATSFLDRSVRKPDDTSKKQRENVRRALRAAGAKLFFLPKYSPDLSRIEMFFAKLKHWLRKAARRTADAVYNAISHILPTVTTFECANLFAKAGYNQPNPIPL
jgi:putative transposase